MEYSSAESVDIFDELLSWSVNVWGIAMQIEN